jgi:hypothetical protein
MQFPADGKVLVSAEGHQRRVGVNVAGKLHFWDIATGEEIATAGLPSVGYFALSPNSRTLTISQQNGDKWAVEVWDARYRPVSIISSAVGQEGPSVAGV